MILRISEKAKKIFKESTDEPYLRIGARPGGCSGWTFTLETDTDFDRTDSVFEKFMIINTKLHNEIIGDLMVDYNDENLVEQGFTFQRLNTGVICGCGESFRPLGDTRKLGWDQ